MRYQTLAAALVASMLLIGVALTPQNASTQVFPTAIPTACQTFPQQAAQIRPIVLGVSGGNIHSTVKIRKAKECFSGTLGSMVQDADGNEYILSNNHVIADQNRAKPGQLIVQPGLIDVACLKSTSDAVATFSRAIKLKFGGGTNYVDAAIAAVKPGDVSPEILLIGETGAPETPVVGLHVMKMGRTTCVTFGTIAGLNASVWINYSDTKKPKLAYFVNQIVITGFPNTPVFGGPGDSGSLIVSQQTVCPQPVALLFAGGSGVTIANPLSEVLTDLNVSMAGTCTASAEPADGLAAGAGLSNEAVASAAAVRNRHEDQLMSIGGAVGTGIGASDEPGRPAIQVYLKQLTPKAQAGAPKEVEGIPVKLVETGELKAF